MISSFGRDVLSFRVLKAKRLLKNEQRRIYRRQFGGKSAEQSCDLNSVIIGNQGADSSLVGNVRNGHRMRKASFFSFGHAFPHHVLFDELLVGPVNSIVGTHEGILHQPNLNPTNIHFPLRIIHGKIDFDCFPFETDIPCIKQSLL